ncbi:MAG: hypothetical protein NC347_02865 [Clostridium sp.]|nr:hypothetical protein [Clostridium sp.]
MILLGLAYLFYSAIQVTPEEGMASAVMSVLTIIYIAGLIGNTFIAFVLVFVFGLIGMVVAVVGQIKGVERRLTTFITPGIAMIMGLVCFAVAAFSGFHICNWDELYQWGKAANFMVEYNRLPNGDQFTGQSLLLSSTTFFHYFMAKLSALIGGKIVESDYYVSNLLLWFSAILLPLSGCRWKDWKKVWGFGIFQFFLAALLFVQPYYNIYTDQATAYWSGAMIAWIYLKKCNKRNIYLVPLLLLNIGMMKNMVGPLFAVLVVITVIILYVSECRINMQPVLPPNWRKILFSRQGLIGIVIALTPIMFVGIWSFIVGKNGLFRGAIHIPDKKRMVLTLKSMVEKLFIAVNMKEDGLCISYLLFFLLVAAIWYLVYPIILKKNLRQPYSNLVGMYLFGFVGYFFIMLFAYLNVFGYVDSIRAMSLDRYFSDYMMLGVIPVTIPLFLCMDEKWNVYTASLKKGIVSVSFIFIVGGCSSYLLPNLFHLYAVDTDLYKERERFITYTKNVKELTGKKGKIYFINQAQSGLYTLVADYEMGNQLIREGMCFNFRKDTKETVLGLTEYDINTLPDVLVEEGYDYLWVYTSNDYFEEEMEKLFDVKKIKNGAFYKVHKSENDVILEYLGNVQK